MNLNGLAKKTTLCNGEIEASFMPYSTIKTRLIWGAMDAIVPNEKWDESQTTFVLFSGPVVDLRAVKEPLSLEAQGVMAWWNSCTGDYAHNYTLFLSLIPMSMQGELVEAYMATRVDLPTAPEILHDGRPDEEADPNVLRAGEKPSKEK